VGPPFDLVVIKAGTKAIAHQIKLEADDPRLDEMIQTWSAAQREALHRLPEMPWESGGKG
jgi:putative proteasome-type protease